MNFLEVVGQKHILRALSNQVKTGQLSHAYLFCGTRGTGKTSVARIFARAINCENPTEGNPCNSCEACVSILQERNLSVVEIDAASNNGVENIRSLREDVKYQPTQGKYKIYIIDEVHMLSSGAFNALLKTLEEPPSYVVFILATTDQHKIPATILSRCQRYDFRRISPDDMVDALKKYLVQECIEFEEEAIDYIVYHSDGAMRDALSLLDQSLSGGEKKLLLAYVLEILGAVDRNSLFELTSALSEKNSMKVLEVIGKAMDAGRDAAQFAADLIRHFRDVLEAGLTNHSAPHLITQAKAVSAAELMEYIHVFSEALREMRFAPHPHTALEVCALKLCVPRVIQEVVQEPVYAPVAPIVCEVEKKDVPAVKPIVSGNIFDKICAEWGEIAQTFPVSWGNWCVASKLENNEGRLELITHPAYKKTLDRHKSEIEEKIARKFGLETHPNLVIEPKEGYNVKIDESKTLSNETTETKEVQQQALLDDWGNENVDEILDVEIVGTGDITDWDDIAEQV